MCFSKRFSNVRTIWLTSSKAEKQLVNTGVMVAQFDGGFPLSSTIAPRKSYREGVLRLEEIHLNNEDLISLDSDAKTLSPMERAIVISAAFLADCTLIVYELTFQTTYARSKRR